MSHADEAKLRKLYPDASARAAADRAIEKLPDDRTMHEHMQVWLEVYWLYSGGRRK